MPIAGVVCMFDKSYQSFEHCLKCHAEYTKNCDALPFAIKMVRDNHIGRQNAGISASTITGCPRELALLEKYDYYEPIEEAWVKGEGSLIHAMLEQDPDPNPNHITERRLYRYLTIDGEDVRISGQMDVVDEKYKVLMDYKRKERVPTRPDPTHELQYNIYVWIIRNGYDIITNEPVSIEIERGGMYYISRARTQPFKKIPYPIWDNADIEDVMTRRLRPILAWRKDGVLPACNPYQTYGGQWKCGCQKIEEQLRERGEWKES